MYYIIHQNVYFLNEIIDRKMPIFFPQSSDTYLVLKSHIVIPSYQNDF